MDSKDIEQLFFMTINSSMYGKTQHFLTSTSIRIHVWSEPMSLLLLGHVPPLFIKIKIILFIKLNLKLFIKIILTKFILFIKFFTFLIKKRFILYMKLGS